MSDTFTLNDIPDLTGKVAIVTGGNAGIGYHTSLELARHGARVLVGSRNKERGQAAVDTIKQEVSGANVELMELDLNSLHQVKQAADAFLTTDSPLNILVTNAGIMGVPFAQTPDGIESQLGVNHLAHHYLISMLADKLSASATPGSPSRIVYVSSEAHSAAPSTGCTVDKLDDPATYSRWPAYGRSKLANILDANAWAKRLQPDKVLVNSLHPGRVNTELFEKMGKSIPIVKTPLIMKMTKGVLSLILLTPSQGAYTSLYVATSPDIVKNGWTGQFFMPYTKHVKPSKQAQDEAAAEALWNWSEETIQRVMAA